MDARNEINSSSGNAGGSLQTIGGRRPLMTNGGSVAREILDHNLEGEDCQ
jgi:hypothetical protein